MATTAVRCLVLGDSTTAEMRVVADWLESSGVVRSDDDDVDLIVVCLAHPDEFSEVEIAARRRACPLARWVVAQSTWCESIGRIRDVWPHAQRVPARWATARLDAELAILRGEAAPLPATAARDETWVFDHPAVDRDPAAAANVLVDSPDRALRSSWIDLLRRSGFEATQFADVVRPRVLVVDGDPWSDVVRSRLETLRATVEPVGIVVAMTIPPQPPPAELSGDDIRVVPKLTPAAVLLDAVRGFVAAHSG